MDGSGNVYLAGYNGDNAFRITPGGVITEIIDATGDGAGNTLDGPWGIAVDAVGDVYLAGYYSHTAFKITPGGVLTVILHSPGDGAGHPLAHTHDTARTRSKNPNADFGAARSSTPRRPCARSTANRR